MTKQKEIEILKSLDLLLENGLINESEYYAKRDSFEQLIDTINSNKKAQNIENLKPFIEIKGLTKHYKGRPKPAIDNLNFNIYPGQFHAFIGANGAGKTTAIKSIIGAYSKHNIKGEILIDGLQHYDVLAKAKIGYIPEYAQFPKKIKTKEYLRLMSMLSGYSKKDANKLVDELLSKMNMTQFANKNPDSFSSGQKKKILLAQALIHNPSILIMDEPAANLDPSARNELYGLLTTLQHEGKAVFLSSHILDEIGKYATYATILDGGKIVFDGSLRRNSDLSMLYKQFVKEGSVDNKG
ncbi:MAG: ABC transporter ATP-binding protein [Mycoplasma sp.]